MQLTADPPPAYDGPVASSSTPDGAAATVRIESRPLDNDAGLFDVLISIIPPVQPLPKQTRAPVDIICVVDVSSSMGEPATLPAEPGAAAEVTVSHGSASRWRGTNLLPQELSILDVVRHAMRVIVSSLNEGDRLAIVPFGSNARIAADLTPMDATGKEAINKVIEELVPKGMTNLWDGLKHGLNLLVPSAREGLQLPLNAPAAQVLSNATPNAGRIATVFCLTDGCPNVNPPRGHVDTLSRHLAQNSEFLSGVSVHTFGFGYSLDSALLMHIARAGSGMFAFVPDLGMLGTVFVHALANALSIWATRVAIQIEYDPSRASVQVLGSRAVLNEDLPPAAAPINPLVIQIGDVRYGQSRNVVLRVRPTSYDGPSSNVPLLTAMTTYVPWTQQEKLTALASVDDLTESTPEARNVVQAESLRIQLANALLNFISWDRRNDLLQMRPLPPAPPEATSPQYQAFNSVIGDLAGAQHPAHADADGQARMALDASHWPKWGRHYIPSLALAHALQRAVNFRDPGQLVYGANCPLFVESRDRADELFDALPPPRPGRSALAAAVLRTGPLFRASGHSANYGDASGHHVDKRKAVSSMQVWNSRTGPCVAGDSLVATPDGPRRIDALVRGDFVNTPRGARQIVAILKTRVSGQGVHLCSVESSLRVTPWHPVRLTDFNAWVFPSDVVTSVKTSSSDCPFVYSLLLASHADGEAHAFYVGGTAVVTLGSGVIAGDVRAHIFLSDYGAVVRALADMPGWYNGDGVVGCVGTIRRGVEGEICGFVADDERSKLDEETTVATPLITCVA